MKGSFIFILAYLGNATNVNQRYIIKLDVSIWTGLLYYIYYPYLLSCIIII